MRNSHHLRLWVYLEMESLIVLSNGIAAKIEEAILGLRAHDMQWNRFVVPREQNRTALAFQSLAFIVA